MKIITPNKVHKINTNSKSLRQEINYHLRVQKKWIKRYGYMLGAIAPNSPVDKFILHGGYAYREGDLLTWACWYELHRKIRMLKQTHLARHFVSTVFLALDHGWMDDQEPVLFETMVFTNEWKSLDQVRTTTYEEAIQDHDNLVNETKRAYYSE